MGHMPQNAYFSDDASNALHQAWCLAFHNIPGKSFVKFNQKSPTIGFNGWTIAAEHQRGFHSVIFKKDDEIDVMIAPRPRWVPDPKQNNRRWHYRLKITPDRILEFIDQLKAYSINANVPNSTGVTSVVSAAISAMKPASIPSVPPLAESTQISRLDQMHNPWLDLPNAAPFVLPSEADLVNRHNQHRLVNAKPKRRINLNLRPVPFIGNPLAPVVLLTLNPGDKEGDEEAQATDAYRRLSHANLRHAGGYYYLDDALSTSPGGRYARSQLKGLIGRVAPDRLYSNVFLAQYMPYHSNIYVDTGMFYPSQDYTFNLVDAAIRRGAMVVILRSKKPWTEKVPALAAYQNVCECSNKRNPTISVKNLGHDNFERLVQAILEPSPSKI